jgi:hypothetical protein
MGDGSAWAEEETKQDQILVTTQTARDHGANSLGITNLEREVRGSIPRFRLYLYYPGGTTEKVGAFPRMPGTRLGG